MIRNVIYLLQKKNVGQLNAIHHFLVSPVISIKIRKRLAALYRYEKILIKLSINLVKYLFPAFVKHFLFTHFIATIVQSNRDSIVDIAMHY